MSEQCTHLVSILMGSQSDWPTMEHAGLTLDELNIPHEVRILSAHRTPEALNEYIQVAEERGIKIFIAGAGGAAHLPGVIAAKTVLPVIGVPMSSPLMNGMDSLLSIVQMPSGIPVATMTVGKAGAINAALFASAILSIHDKNKCRAIQAYREKHARTILENSYPKG